MDKNILIHEIEALPPNAFNEIFDYIHNLKLQRNGGEVHEITLASEKALAKDWLLPVEDTVWADL